MPSIYDKSVKELVSDFVGTFVPPPAEGPGLPARTPLAEGGHFTRKEIRAWFVEHYPKIKTGTVNCHLIRMSTNVPSRAHHTLRSDGADDLLCQIDSSRFRLYDPNKDPDPIYPATGKGSETTPIDTDDENDQQEPSTEFAYEQDLRNYLVKNLPAIEPGLTLYEDEDVKGIEFPAGGRFIDILAVSAKNELVVIELKVSRGYDRVVGQLARYIAWIKKHQAEPEQHVRGIIVAREISEDLRLAFSVVPNVQLFEYELSLILKQVKMDKSM